MVEDLQEFNEGKDLYELVLQFQKAFGHSYNPSENPGDWRSLVGKDRVDRGKWMAEEVMEYIVAGEADQIDQVDALVDLLYFILGTFVMIGFNPFIHNKGLKNMAEYGRQMATYFHEEYGDWHPPAADRLYAGSTREWRAKSASYAIDLIFDFMKSQFSHRVDENGQIKSLKKLMDWTLKEAAVIGANLEPYFLIVHTSNMGKLWPDGRPRYREDGKVIKPETWESPRGEMRTHMLMELQGEEDDAEIPF